MDIVGKEALGYVCELLDTVYNGRIAGSIGLAPATFSTDILDQSRRTEGVTVAQNGDGGNCAECGWPRDSSAEGRRLALSDRLGYASRHWMP
jgi:hypothetical protein